jgi:hypothetical protein
MPASPERPADGARPARGPASLLGTDAAPLDRARRIFLALALLGCALAAIAIAGVPDRTAGLRVAGVAAVAALAAVWLRAHRRGGLSSWDEPIELLALFAVALAAGPDMAIVVIYTGLCQRSLYGTRTRAAIGFAVYATAWGVAVAADGAVHGVVHSAEQLLPLAIGCAVMQAFAAMLGRHERSLERERILRDASGALVEARDRPAVYAAAMRAVERLGDGRPPAAVLAVLDGDGSGDLTVRAATGPWLPGIVSSRVPGSELPRDLTDALARGGTAELESPRLAGLELYAPPDVAALGGVCVPLSVRGELRGLLALFGPALSGTEEVDALISVAGEAALALAALDGADAAADDRSIERLSERVPGMI